MENWLPVVGRDGYEVSDLGRVRSLPRRVPYGINGATMSRKGRVIKPFLTGNMGNRQGSLVVSLGRGHRFRIAHMVLEAFVGARPEGMLARHLDDDPYNNRVSNLMWGTYSENAYDAVRNKKNYQSIKTECPKGHPYDTVWSGGKQRACKTCHNERTRDYKRRVREGGPIGKPGYRRTAS